MADDKKEGATIPTWAFGAVIAVILAGVGALMTVGGDRSALERLQQDVKALFERVDNLAKESREADDRIEADMKELEDEARQERSRIDERLRQHELGKQH